MVRCSGHQHCCTFPSLQQPETKDNTTCIMQGSIGMGSGDLSLDNTSIANGQTITINTFSLTDANAKMPEIKIIATGSVGWPSVIEMRQKLKESDIESSQLLDAEVLEAYKDLMENGCG